MKIVYFSTTILVTGVFGIPTTGLERRQRIDQILGSMISGDDPKTHDHTCAHSPGGCGGGGGGSPGGMPGMQMIVLGMPGMGMPAPASAPAAPPAPAPAAPPAPASGDMMKMVTDLVSGGGHDHGSHGGGMGGAPMGGDLTSLFSGSGMSGLGGFPMMF